MQIALLNLISTPAAVLPSLGLRLGIGFSSEDPMVGRHPSEPYDMHLSVYAPDGGLARRLALGRIAPHRRRLLDASSLVEPFGFDGDHLVVAHRVPARLADRHGAIDVPVAVSERVGYDYFRTYVQYGYPEGRGAHGSVIYEVPPRFNEAIPGAQPPVVLTFTTKIVLSETVTTCVALINYSTNPRYATTADYRFAAHAGDGSQAAAGACAVPPFSVRVIDLGRVIPDHEAARARDPHDGLSHFCFYGICENAAVAVVVLNLAPAAGGVSVEHTHPTQSYVLAPAAEKQRIKREAIVGWRGLMVASGARQPA